MKKIDAFGSYYNIVQDSNNRIFIQFADCVGNKVGLQFDTESLDEFVSELDICRKKNKQ